MIMVSSLYIIMFVFTLKHLLHSTILCYITKYAIQTFNPLTFHNEKLLHKLMALVFIFHQLIHRFLRNYDWGNTLKNSTVDFSFVLEIDLLCTCAIYNVFYECKSSDYDT